MLFVGLPFRMSPGGRAEVLSGVSKHQKAAMCPVEKIHVLDKLCLGMRCSAVGQEFNVNESTIHTK